MKADSKGEEGFILFFAIMAMRVFLWRGFLGLFVLLKIFFEKCLMGFLGVRAWIGFGY